VSIPAENVGFVLCVAASVRLLGDIATDEEGAANVSFAYPTNSVGNLYAFEMYPEGAPPGNRYQSAEVASCCWQRAYRERMHHP
jgi:hypothetical protein